MHVVLVHGYSVRSLETYGMLPKLLEQSGYKQDSIFLSAFDSLSDEITCDDLAKALEMRVKRHLEKKIDISKTALLCHSTGAIITRRWLLNRYKLGLPVPRTLITVAGANHGSTLAQLGMTQIAYVYRNVFQQTSVGRQVLEDLDYGSEFLLKLNKEWLEAFNSNSPPQTYCFSMIGDDHSELSHQVFWQTKEWGSDGTVRVSSGNLNYRMLNVDLLDGNKQLEVHEFKTKVPNLVIPDWSHVGKKGIIDALSNDSDPPFEAMKQALDVDTSEKYSQVQQEWEAKTLSWSQANQDHCCSTAVFSLHHPGGRHIEDCLILIRDNKESLETVGASLCGHQPIQNNLVKSSISFYLNQPKYALNSPHSLYIEVNSGTDEINYEIIDYPLPPKQASLLKPNEFTYLSIVMARNPEGTFRLLSNDPNRDVKKKWPPLPEPDDD
ncbi:MAG: hypothetical protein NW224_17745 [Leptolyngbyaceae cyanobacterium bins.302]|nr:hypothetical protein [Leptolyngbyaceae cyanobacterium bins.302]